MKQSSGKQTHMLLLSRGPRREDTNSLCTTHLNRRANLRGANGTGVLQGARLRHCGVWEIWDQGDTLD